jgi:DNA-directed RNA polymerase specialized sigma24 family protein
MAIDNFSEFFGKLRAGDPTAVKEFLQHFERYIHRVARLRMADGRARDMCDSQDICQSVIKQLFAHASGDRWNGVKDMNHLRRLLVKMVIQKLIDRDRAGKLRAGAIPPGREVALEDEQALVDDQDFAAYILSGLNGEERWLLVEHAGNGRTFPDLAAESKRSPDALRVAYNRLLVKIRRLFGEE